MPKVETNGLELHYEEQGAGEPLLLIMGVGAQLVHWPAGFVDLLAEQFRVIRFDNRDIGLSTHLSDAPIHNVKWQMARRMTGLKPKSAYLLADMALDTVGLLDALGLETVHLVGISMGGMVAQELAIDHGHRLRSLTILMSTPGGTRHRPKVRALAALVGPPPQTVEEAGERGVAVFRAIGSPGYAFDEARTRETSRQAFTRSNNPAGFARQMNAIVASGDRTPRLARVSTPTLILHGEEDPLVPIEAGRALSALISGARIKTYPGMGHDLPADLWPELTGEILRHAQAHSAQQAV